MCELGRPLLEVWHRILRFVIVRDGGCGHMYSPTIRLSWCSGVTG
jgi:hypothetical protein|nr:MAG TPA: hypothetical protein [Caudoviricetes sp.]